LSKNSVQLIIDGEIWLQVSDFNNSTPFDRHFMMRRLQNGHDVFIFGNGELGCRPSERYGNFASPYKLQTLPQKEIQQPDIPPTEEIPHHSLAGIYRAVVISNEDPDNKMKVRVKIDAIPEMGLLWAAAVVPLKENDRIRPTVGDLVWISFRNGDANQPLWLGKISEEEPPSVFVL
jgi:hypothetical protein